MARKTPYTTKTMVWDLILFFITGGMWFVWIMAREWREFHGEK